MMAPELLCSFKSHINPRVLSVYQMSERPEVDTVYSSLLSDAMLCCGGAWLWSELAQAALIVTDSGL